MQFVIAICAVVAVGLFLNIRGMVRLLLNDEKKLFVWSLGFFLGVPTLLTGLYFLLRSNHMSMWIYFPMLALFIIWSCEGFFLEAYLRKEIQRKLDGIKRVPPAPPKNNTLKNGALIVFSLAIWYVGVFVGIENPTLETCALCICVFLLVRAISSLWRYRGF